MIPPRLIDHLEQALRTLRYGSIQLIVHEARVVRIERIEHIRLTEPSEAIQQPSGQPTTTTEVRRHVEQEA